MGEIRIILFFPRSGFSALCYYHATEVYACAVLMCISLSISGSWQEVALEALCVGDWSGEKGESAWERDFQPLLLR